MIWCGVPLPSTTKFLSSWPNSLIFLKFGQLLQKLLVVRAPHTTSFYSAKCLFTFDYWECPKGDKKWFPSVEMTPTLQVKICFIVPCSQIIKRNNQIIKINDQISQITILWIRSRLVRMSS